MANRRPNATKARAIELLERGLSEREVLAALRAEGHSASAGSIHNWKAASGSAKAASAPGCAAPSRPSSSPAVPASAGAPLPADPCDELLPDTDLVHLPAELLERLARKFTLRIEQEVGAAGCDPQLLGGLMRDFERISKALVMARPPQAADPAKDPLNLEQAAIALGHVRRMIAEARQRRATPETAAATP